MKSFLSVVVMGLFLFISETVSGHTFKGKVRNLDGCEISYYASADGMILPIRTMVELDVDSTFVIDFSHDTPECINILVQRKGLNVFKKFFVTDRDVSVTIDPRTDEVINPVLGIDPLDVAAADAVENVSKKYWDFVSGAGDYFNIKNDSVPSSVQSKLMVYADTVMMTINRADLAVRGILRQNMAMFLGDIFYSAYMRACSRRSGYSDSTKTEWDRVAGNVIEWVDPDNRYNSYILQTFGDFAGFVMMVECKNNMPEIKNYNDRNSVFFKFFEHRFSGKNAQVLMADIITADSETSRYSTGLPQLASEFKLVYPGSALMPYVDKALEINQRANNNDENPLIHFVDVSNVHSLSDLFALYKGKTILLDVWATWCGPCRNAFTKIKPVQDVAKEKDIVLLYISVDEREGDDVKVRQFANMYGLVGEHAIINPDLKKDVFEKFGNGGYLSIPHTALIGPDGEFIHVKMEESEDPAALAEKLRSL